MANAPFQKILTDPAIGGATYTVPANKIAYFTAFFLDSGGSNTGILQINGVAYVFMSGTAQIRSNMVAKAGDVISVSSATGNYRISIIGLLSDVASEVAFGAVIKTTGSATYTVPALKYAVFSAYYAVSAVAGSTVSVGTDGQVLLASGGWAKSLTATAGQVVSCTGSGVEIGLMGLLFPA